MTHRLAFSTLACPGWRLEQVADAARANGYEGVELRLLDGEMIEPDIRPEARRRVRSVLVDAGLPVVAVDTSIRLAGADPVPTASALRRLLDVAADWGAPLLRVFGGEAGGERDAAFAAMARLLDAAVPEAERLGVGIALETHDAFSSAREVAALLQRVASPAVGALWDVLHTCRVGEPPELVTELLAGRLLHVHVKDGRGRPGDAAWELVPLGEGDVPMVPILRTLRARGYAGWFSVEWEKRWHPELAEPEVALPQHAEAMARLAAEAAAEGGGPTA